MDSSQSDTPRTVNILQLVPWLVGATAQSKGFLLKPTDVKILYTLFLWEYMNKYHFPGKIDDKTEIPEIADDSKIALPEAELLRLVQLYFNKSCYQYFGRLSAF